MAKPPTIRIQNRLQEIADQEGAARLFAAMLRAVRAARAREAAANNAKEKSPYERATTKNTER